MTRKLRVNIPPEHHVKVLGGQGWVGLLDHMGSEATIVNAARVSFGKRKETMDEHDVKLLRYLIKNRHTTPLEHVVFTFIVHCPLFVRSQWHRHRTWSFNEISRRYTQEDIEFFVPSVLRGQADNDRQASVESDEIAQEYCLEAIKKQHKVAFAIYEQLLADGVCREQARGVLPQNMMTTFWGSVDLNNLIKFLELRDDEHAQAEIREYAVAIKKLVKPFLPNLFEIFGWHV